VWTWELPASAFPFKLVCSWRVAYFIFFFNATQPSWLYVHITLRYVVTKISLWFIYWYFVVVRGQCPWWTKIKRKW
jgi:hypothetical protein